MFVVIGKKDGKCRILDTEDGILVVHSSFEDVFSDFFSLMRGSSSFSDKQSDVENGYAAVRDWGS